MSLYTPQNRVIGLQLAAAHQAGSGSLQLQAGQGARITGPFPARATVVTQATYGLGAAEVATIFGVTAVAGDVVTVAGAIDGTTDRNFGVGDYFEMRASAGYIGDLNTSVTALNASVAALNAGVAPLASHQAANAVWAGPSSGPAAAPSFRALAAADLPAGTGTVTSVGLSLPPIFAVTGSPVTGTGTLSASAAPQAANAVWAGPGSGPAAAPSFRALAAADLPAVPVSGLSGTLGVSQGGTGTTSLTPYAVLCGGVTGIGAVQAVAGAGASGQVLTSNGAAAPPSFKAPSGVTSVGLTMPANFAVTGSPVAGAGTLAVTATTPAVQVFTSSGSYAVPAGATIVKFCCVGGGAGGGGGSCAAPGVAAYG
jgi:hypothetical protein